MGETYGLITAPKRAAPLSQYFQERIFFSDLVEIEDQSERWIQVELGGPEAPGILKALLEIGEAPTLNQVAEGRLGEWPLKVIAERGVNPSFGHLILAPREASDALDQSLAESGAIRLSDEQAELLRIEAGMPGTMELTPDYTPYELGLGDWVSETKGCYTGQEVLARQVTYDKITRQLVQLSAESPFTDAREVLADDKVVGRITSATLSPSFGPLALAVVKRPFNDVIRLCADDHIPSDNERRYACDAVLPGLLSMDIDNVFQCPIGKAGFRLTPRNTDLLGGI